MSTVVHEAKVIEIKDRKMLVLIDRSCDENRCASCGLCGNNKKHDATLKLTMDVTGKETVGDLVKVEVKLPNTALVALVVFGLPLGLAVLGGVAGYLIDKSYDGAIIIGGIAGLAFGFTGVFFADRYLSFLKPEVRVIEA